MQTGLHRGAVAGCVLDHHAGSSAGYVGGAVARAVVDHDHGEVTWNAREQSAQGRSFVAAGEDQVTGRHRLSNVGARPAAASTRRLTFRDATTPRVEGVPTTTDPTAPVHVGRGVPWAGLGVAVALVVAAFAVPPLFGVETYSRALPAADDNLDPIIGYFDQQWFGPGTLPALAVAALATWYAVDMAGRLPWGRLLLTSYAVGLAWLVALAAVRGEQGFVHALESPPEYLVTARTIDDVPYALETWVDRIPYGAADGWQVHVSGHPPLATLFFVVLLRWGLSSLAIGLVVTAIAASTALAVLVTLRALDAEPLARRVAPFLVLTPAAVFMAVSADAMFAAVAAWGLATLAIAATAGTTGRLVGWSAVAGLLLGACVMLSYGLPLLGILALAVLAAARSWRPLPIAAVAALVVVVAFVPFGFSWWEAFPVLRDRYWDGLASARPGGYWTWANLGALTLSGGPLLGAGLATLVALGRRADRVALLLAGAAVLMIVVADLSQMSRAEAERIWLPFLPWLTVSIGVLPEVWRRWGLALQVACAISWSTSSTRTGEAQSRSGAVANAARPAAGSTCAVKPSSALARAGEATTCRTSPSR